ncbi:alanine--tRNA ligase [Methanobrevibacter filiformis]|uniref:Alanine--tRNA ligase n=1 Tax=Methanobrevibacter filiformis TaxID=55758 RepID=A0A166FI84_9EURY|nr:alanine--tRNA ligase [Methanobrevibacter filiformis]KZX17700.1 alanine--tRNA ligase [Methanobrevibacter filiformis]
MFEIFKELGYQKRKCETCGSDFWSINERSTCGDAPCDEYEFIGDPPTDNSYNLYEIQKTFTEFFENRNHTYTTRYPVLAKRWRDDVFLVGASIYDFQPWVTSGLMEPPANPLTIAQPAIRLNDVDNVGRTGRHMTCFTMGAHHAFNSPEREIYWDNETIKLCHDFIESIGIAGEEITFIESWWEGGGNAGPCLEVCVRGVELATLVFMQYKILPNGEKEEIPLRTVDTGYGLERFAWISQGTPTAYDACFAPVVDKLKEITSVNVNETILAENAQIAGMMDIETFADIRVLRKTVAEKLNITVEELLRSAEPMEAIYIIADHTRCLAFMISDGIIPSNVKEGYLARLVLRRTIRFMKELKIEESLAEIMKIQLEFLTKFYPEIKDSYNHIMNIINIEEKRYFKTIEKGEKIVKRTIKNLKKQNTNEMPLETLMNLYDAHGMPPETVKEIAINNNFTVNIPDNFFTLIADSHTEETHAEKEILDISYPETELLFYDNFNRVEAKSKLIGVEEIKDNLYLIFDKTVFYPEGGGQPSDLGKVFITDDNNNTIDISISHTEKVDGVVLHQVFIDEGNNDYLKLNKTYLDNFVGKTVIGIIDWDRRIALARNHTATHLIIAASKEVLGSHIWQAGAQKGLNHSRLDLSHYKRISQEELDEIEKIANGYVMDNLKVDTTFMSRTEAEKTYGLNLYQGGIVPGSIIRVVKVCNIDIADGDMSNIVSNNTNNTIAINNNTNNNNTNNTTNNTSNNTSNNNSYIDVQACAGTHVLNTGDIGLIKLNKTERVQDGVERLDFSAGMAAIESMERNDSYLRESSSILKVNNEQLPKTCDRFFSEWKSYKNEIQKLQKEIANLKASNIENDIIEIKGLKVLTQALDGDIKEIQKIATDFTDNKKVDVIVIGNKSGNIVAAVSQIAIDNGIKANDLIKQLAPILGGGGGGRPNLAQGAGPKEDKIQEALDLAIKLIEN